LRKFSPKLKTANGQRANYATFQNSVATFSQDRSTTGTGSRFNNSRRFIVYENPKVVKTAQHSPDTTHKKIVFGGNIGVVRKSQKTI
jgi:hypothetical protein